MKEIKFVSWDLRLIDIFFVNKFLFSSFFNKYVPWSKIGEVERKITKVLGCKEAILTSSCSGSLHTILYCLGIKEGDEVITTPLSFISTANVIKLLRAKPIFVDVREDTFNIDVGLIEKKITKKTRAILVVDLFGNPCDYDNLKKICRKYKLPLVADSAQAFGSKYKGKLIGNIADYTCFSFEYYKNITSLSGGLITTNNLKMAEKMRRFINYGYIGKGKVKDFGWNYKPNDLLVCLLKDQLNRVGSLVKERNLFADFYKKNISAKKFSFQKIEPGNVSNYSQFSALARTKKTVDKLIEYFDALNIEVIRPITYYKGVFSKNDKESLKVFVRIIDRLISFPINRRLRSSMVKDSIKKGLSKMPY